MSKKKRKKKEKDSLVVPLLFGAGLVGAGIIILSKQTKAEPTPTAKHKECVNNKCVDVLGVGINKCLNDANCQCVPPCGQCETCINNGCQPIAGCCVADADCGAGKHCVGGICQPIQQGCQRDSQCPELQVCVGGNCIDCDANHPCLAGEQCVGNVCQPAGGCINDADCGAGKFCNNGVCGNCKNGITSTQACGINNRGTQTRTCANGQWGEFGACADPDQCRNGATQNQACGLNNNGTQTRTCVAGQYGNWSACNDPDECRNNDTRLPTDCCGGGGIWGERCVGGNWVDTGEECPVRPAIGTKESDAWATCIADDEVELGIWVRNTGCQAGTFFARLIDCNNNGITDGDTKVINQSERAALYVDTNWVAKDIANLGGCAYIEVWLEGNPNTIQFSTTNNRIRLLDWHKSGQLVEVYGDEVFLNVDIFNAGVCSQEFRLQLYTPYLILVDERDITIEHNLLGTVVASSDFQPYDIDSFVCEEVGCPAPRYVLFRIINLTTNEILPLANYYRVNF